MRLDKFLSNLWYASRKEIAKYIKNNSILVNGEYINQKDFIIKYWDNISILDENITYLEDIFIILNKPIWYVSSDRDEWWHLSYKNLLKNCPYNKLVHIVWRLDFDTTWLLLLTNNWKLTHNIIHPKKDIFKKYLVVWELDISKKDVEKLEKWVIIDWEITKPAKVEVISKNSIYLSISEWKFHQVKKMFEAIWNKVLSLNRVSIWWLQVWDLKLWEWKYINKKDLDKVFI